MGESVTGLVVTAIGVGLLITFGFPMTNENARLRQQVDQLQAQAQRCDGFRDGVQTVR